MAGKPHCILCRTAVVTSRGETCEACLSAAADYVEPDAAEQEEQPAVDALTRAMPALEVEVPPPSAPSAVRALQSFWTFDTTGRAWRIGLRGVYVGDEAARLVDLHPDLVEPFPRPVAP